MLKFALVGCGRISQRHADLLGKGQIAGAQLVAVCDVQIKRAQALGEKFNVPYFANMHEMLSEVAVDALSVLTPSGMHAEHVLELAPYGKSIIVEKPMALTLHDADQMITACEKHKSPLFVVKQNRFNVPVVKMREEIERKSLGRLVMGTIRVRWCREQKYYDQDSWRGTWQWDGGVFTNQASHHVDLLQWTMGEVESVFAKAGTFLVNTETEDTGIAVIKFKSGALGVIEATTAVRPKDLEGSITVLGEKGTIEIGGFAVNQIRHWNLSGQAERSAEIIQNYSVNPPNVYGYGHKAYYEDVVESIKDPHRKSISGHEGRKSLELIQGIYESIFQQKEIFFPFDALKSPLGQKEKFKTQTSLLRRFELDPS